MKVSLVLISRLLMILVLKDSGGAEFLHKTMMTLEREHLDKKKCFLSALLEKGLGGRVGEWVGGMPLPDFFGIFFSSKSPLFGQ